MSQKYKCPYCGVIRVGIKNHILAKHPEHADGFEKPCPIPKKDEKVTCPFCLGRKDPKKFSEHVRGDHGDDAWDLYQRNGHLWPKGTRISTPKEIRRAEINKAMAERGPLAAVNLIVSPMLDDDASSPVLAPDEIKRGTSHYWDRMRARKKAEEEAQAAKAMELLAKDEPPEDDLTFLDNI